MLHLGSEHAVSDERLRRRNHSRTVQVPKLLERQFVCVDNLCQRETCCSLLPRKQAVSRTHDQADHTTGLSIDRRSNVCHNGWVIFSSKRRSLPQSSWCRLPKSRRRLTVASAPPWSSWAS